MRKDKSINMLEGPLIPDLIRFAMPIAASSILQQLFNSADTLVVGRFANADALAAVGTNGEIVALLVALSTGLSVGANVLAASMIGNGRRNEFRHAVRSSLVVAFISGCLLAIAGLFLAGPLLHIIHTPVEIMDDAVLYLKIYLMGYPLLMLYNFGSALLRADGDSLRPFEILTVSGIINIFLNLFFVIVMKMDVDGVAFATDISSLISCVLVLGTLFRKCANMQESTSPGVNCTSRLLVIGIPAALQGGVFCLANIFVQTAVNSFGTAAVAGNTISMNFEYIAYFMVTAFGQAVTTFTSQNHAADKNSRCIRILKSGVVLSIIFSALICVPVIIFRVPAAGLFSTQEDVIRIASLRILWIITLQSFCGLFEIPASFMRGMGHSFTPAVETILGICVFRIMWVLTLFQSVHTLKFLFLAFPLSWAITSALVLFLTKRLIKKSQFIL